MSAPQPAIPRALGPDSGQAPAGSPDLQQVRATLAAAGLPELPERLAGSLVDSHTHLDTVAQITGVDVATSLAAARAVGVDRMVQIGCDLPSSRWAVDLAASQPRVVAAVAIHPNDAAELGARSRAALDEAVEGIDRLAGAGPHVRAVGETGIDHHGTRDEEGRALQREVLAAHVAIAKSHGLTLAIHMRDGERRIDRRAARQGHDDLLDVLDAEGWPERTIMHCFAGDVEVARRCLDHGAWLSFSGVVTFASAHNQRESLALAPDDRILVETDAPFLTPVPERGRRNGPYLVAHTARFVAQRRGWSETQACRLLSANAEAAYGGPWGGEDASLVQPCAEQDGGAR